MKITLLSATFLRTALGGLVAGVGICASAATYTWTGTGFITPNYLWSDDFNWAGNKGPTPGETNVTLIFPNNAAPKIMTNDLIGLSAVSVIFFGSNYVVHGKPTGNPLTLQGNPGGNWALGASFNGSQFAGTSPISLGSTGTVAVASGAMFTINSQIYGTGALVKDSPGTLRLAGAAANLYSGGTVVLDGILELNNAGNAIPGALKIGGTNLSLSPIVRLLADNQIANTAPICLGRNSELRFNTHNDTVGPICITNGAKLSTGYDGGDASPGLLTLNGNITNCASAIGISASISGRVDFGGATRIIDSAYFLQFSAVISGSGGVTLTGPGTVAFYSANTYSGPTLVQNGELDLVASGTPGSTASGTTVAAGAWLTLVDAQIGNESLSLHGSSQYSMHFAGTNVWNGPVSLGGECLVQDDSTPGDGDVPDLTIAGSISGTGALRKQGYGKLHFTGFGGNTFSGGFFCQQGFAYFDKSASAPALGGPLVIGEPTDSQFAFVTLQQVNQIPNTLPISVLENGSLFTDSGAADTLGPVELTGGIMHAVGGLLTLAGNITNHFSPVANGRIFGDVAITGNQTFHCDSNSVLDVMSSLSGSGGIVKAGPGELKLQGACTYEGYTKVDQGRLTLAGSGRPGGPSSGTEINPGAALYLDGVSITNEYLTLYGGGANGSPALIHHNTNSWIGGTVELHSSVNIKAEPTADLSFTGKFTGAGSLSHSGDGTLALGGNEANDYTGTTTFRQGTLRLNKSAGLAAIPHSLFVGYGTNGSPSTTVKCLAANQFAPLFGAELGSGGVSLYQSALLDCGGLNQSVANLYLKQANVDTSGGVLSLAGNFTVEPSDSQYSFLFGTVQLVTGINNTHLFAIANGALAVSSANFTEAGTQNIYKDGGGQFGSLGALIFGGTLTIHQGRWLAANANPFGGTAGPTVVEAGATLVTFAGSFSEPLQLAGNGDGGMGALYSNSTNSFDGPITLMTDATIYAESNAVLSLHSAIGGPGKLTKEGSGLLRFTGLSANTYSGGTVVSHGILELTKNGGAAVPGDLTCLGNSGNNGVRLLLPEQIADAASVKLQGSDFLDLNNNNDTVGSLSGSGPVQLGSATLTTGGNGADTSFSGGIGGSGGLTKTGAGTMTLWANNSYTGVTALNGGKLIVNGQQPSSPVSITTGGALVGAGRVGNIGDLNGTISPGASLGILVCSNYATFSPANQLQIEINGLAPGSGYDQLQVNGSVLLMGGTLQVSMNAVGAVSNQYVIVSNDGVDAVSGTFTGLPEGAWLTNNGAAFVITYHGGDGNDIALVQQSLANALQIISGQRLPNGRFAITAIGSPNTSYSVEACTNLASPAAWTQIGTAVANGSGNISFSDVAAPLNPIRFYRLRYP